MTKNYEMKQKIKDCLINGNHQHEFAKLTDNSTEILKINELNNVYSRLIKNIIEIPAIQQNTEITLRPNCPITGPKEMNKARIEYKVQMIEYIKQFGICLTESSPCHYIPAILEALANYCEKNMRLKNKSD